MNNKKYNYHSHTYRCGHASDAPDYLYLTTAIGDGYDKYGISDHVPVHPIFYTDSSVRMNDKVRDEYIISMKNLKEQYKEFINFYYGFEAEYDEIIEVKIDKTGPTINVNEENITKTTNSIEIEVSVEDTESGMPETVTYEYYIKKSTETEYPSSPIETTEA